jgi:hypothetical protein
MNITSLCGAAIGPELHCLFLDDSGRVCHRIRLSDTNWSAWGRLAKKGFKSITPVAVGIDLHIVALDESDILWHNIRFTETQKWQGWIQMPDQPLLDIFDDLDS